MKAVNVKDEKFFLPLWEEDKFRELIMISAIDRPIRIYLRKEQSLLFSKGARIKGSEDFLEAPKKDKNILKLMYMGDNNWLEYETSGEFNIVKKEMKK